MNRSGVEGVSVSRLNTMLDRGDIDMIKSGLAGISDSRLNTMIRLGQRSTLVSIMKFMVN